MARTKVAARAKAPPTDNLLLPSVAKALAQKDKAGKGGDKDKKRKTKQERAGLQVSVSRCRRKIERKWPGHISNEAAVVMAAFLQYIDSMLITDAAAAAASESPTARITSSHVQTALSKNAWLRKSRIIRGRVLGTAPITMNVAQEDDEDQE